MVTSLPRKYMPAATWIFNICTLFANELFNGYKYGNIAEILQTWAPPAELEPGVERVNWGTVLDDYGGIMSRWEILFNLTVLRLISFNLDYYWSLDRKAGSPIEVRSPDLIRPARKLC
jgi:hypothetical protein